MAKRSNLLISVTQHCNWGLTVAFSVMWILSYNFYTSFGIDTDKVKGDQVISSYYRVRWPGNGSFWLGGGADYRRLSVGPIEEFDLGGAFFDKPQQKPVPHSIWNQLGFWWINELNIASNNPRRYVGAVWGFWVGVPSWMPVILVGCWSLRRWLDRKQRVFGATVS